MKYRRGYWWRYFPTSIEGIRALNRLILGDHVLRIAGGEAHGCLTLEAALGVRIYSLRKPWRTTSSRYFQRLLQ